MLFKKKKSDISCPRCNSSLLDEFSYCPYCGLSLISKEQEMRDFGMLGKNDFLDQETARNAFFSNSFSMTDKIISSIFTSMMKNIEEQMSSDLSRTEVKPTANGIKMRLSAAPEKKQKLAKRTISEEQIKRMSELPRAKAKTNIRRLSDKIIYEIDAPGVLSPEDIFISRVENGYEVKAIGEKKVYVNNMPINLPIKSLSMDKNKLLFEFKNQDN